LRTVLRHPRWRCGVPVNATTAVRPSRSTA
jgi:hypothetical protein